MSKFVGNKEILTVVDLEEKTPSKQDVVEVSFVDETSEVMPKLRFEMIVTEEASSLTGIQNTVKAKVGGTIYGTMLEYGIKWDEVNDVVEAAVGFVNDGYARACDHLFKSEKGNISLIDINKILINHATDNNDGTAPSGSGASTENPE